VVMPAAVVYYLTVASADNWAGAVCNLGRYFMPVAPLAVALVGMALGTARGNDGAETADPSGPGRSEALGMTGRGVLALSLILAAWTALFAVMLWQDPHAANDSAVLLAKSTYADGNQYIPNLFIRQWSEGAPGLWARIAVWLAALAATAIWLRRVVSGGLARPRGTSPVATLAAVAAFVLAAGLLLERWPGARQAPVFPRAIGLASAGGETTPPTVLFLGGEARVREGEAVVGPGAVELLVRSPLPVASLKATVGGAGGVLRAAGLPPVVLRQTGASLELPLVPYHEVRGREGRRAVYSRARLDLEGEAALRPGVQGEMEPDADGNR